MDHGSGCWHEFIISHIFPLCNAEIILNLPLWDAWPNDKLVWHYNNQSICIGRSAYHLIIDEWATNHDSPSSVDNSICKALWKWDIPPWIKLFGLRACWGAFPSALNISKCIVSFGMSHTACGHAEESDVHSVLKCPLAVQIWNSSPFQVFIDSNKFRSLIDCFEKARQQLKGETVRDFLAIMWEFWNARNRFIFSWPDKNLSILSKRPLDFIKCYWNHRELELATTHIHHPNSWRPPSVSYVKLNLDGGQPNNSGWGWGFVLRNHLEDLLLAGTKHGRGFAGAMIEEARSCLFGVKSAFNLGYRHIIIEGDNLSLVQLLKSRSTQDNSLGYFTSSILLFIQNFEFFFLVFCKERGKQGSSWSSPLATIMPGG